jgi:hypothetical protein
MKAAMFILLIIIQMLLSCSRLPIQTSGGSTSTGNERIAGTVFYASGKPASGATVIVRRNDYLSRIDSMQNGGASLNRLKTLTDSQGRFTIDSVDTGEYFVEGNDRMSAAGLIKVTIGSTTGNPLPLTDILSPYGCIKGNIGRQTSVLPRFCRVYGLERAVPVDSAGQFIINDLPAGTYGINIASRDSSYAPISVDGITLSSGDTVAFPFATWAHSRRLYLNTTASGAGTMAPLTDFPVLVRLTHSNFNFSEAQNSGADIRFTLPDGTVLPMEIQRFDPSAQSAEIWVKVDTVFGNDSTHYFTMYWGNSNAASASNGGAVFDTSNGFLGVWHLNKNCDDATYHIRQGTPSATSDTLGVIGYGQRFNGNAFIKIPGLLGAPQILTLSAWALLDTVFNIGAEVVSIGDGALIRMDDSWENQGTHGAYCVNPAGGIDSTHCVVKSGVFLKKTGWHYLAYSVDVISGSQRQYIDGSLCCVTDSTAPVVYKGIGTDTYLGKHANGRTEFNFCGAMNEVRVCGTVRSADWIRLCYMNQRPDDKLIIFKQGAVQ